jgi:hypothetical protein
VPDFDLTTLDGLLGAVAAYDEKLLRKQAPPTGGSGSSPPSAETEGPRSGDDLGEFTGTYCTRCSGPRRMRLVAHDDRCRNLNPRNLKRTRQMLEEMNANRDSLPFAIGIPPPVFTATCLQCQRQMSLIVDSGPPTEIVVLGSRAAGLSTAHTPDGIAFYLEQAYRARTAGAYTAATAMYRAALEVFLHDQGYPSGTLAARIDAAVAASPDWVQQLDEELMHALRTLGNWAVHRAGSDVSSQAVLDRQLVHDTEHLLMDVLDEVYELPARRAERRARMLKGRGEQPST